jgi:hypothetical protein
VAPDPEIPAPAKQALSRSGVDRVFGHYAIQQFRAVITGEAAHRCLVHDHDALYAPAVDRAMQRLA